MSISWDPMRQALIHNDNNSNGGGDTGNVYFHRKSDQGKPRYDLLPPEQEDLLARIYTFGAEKYEDDSWQTVPDGVRRYYAAARRHMVAFRSGEYLDPESGFPHLGHAAWNMLAVFSLISKHGQPYVFNPEANDGSTDRTA